MIGDGADHYSPQLRTALVLTGTGTAGAYHAGVLRALHEAGVKLDIVAGRGVGVVGALFSAVDGAQRLWDEKGFWRSSAVGSFYSWTPMLQLAACAVAVALVVVVVPLAVAAAGVVFFPMDFVLKMAGIGGARGLASWYVRMMQAAFAPEALPTWLPRLVVLVLGLAALTGVVSASIGRGTRRRFGPLWWRALPAPL